MGVEDMPDERLLISTKTSDNRSRLTARTSINSWPTRRFVSTPTGCEAS
jgi:hypothetical protein